MPPRKAKATKTSSKRAAEDDSQPPAPSKQVKTAAEDTEPSESKPIENTAADEDEEASDPSFDFNSPINSIADGFVEDTENHTALRTLVTFNEAIAIIGPSGKSLKDQAKESTVKVDLTGRELGAVERMLVVTGTNSAIANYCELVIRRQLQKFKVDTIRIRILVAAALLSSIVGTRSNTLNSIQNTSGAMLAVVTVVLPQSTDRLITVTGNAEQVRKAVDMVTMIMIQNKDKLKTVPAIPYYPVPMYGKYGHPRLLNSERVRRAATMTSHNPYGLGSNQQVSTQPEMQQQQQPQQDFSQVGGAQVPLSGPVGPGGQIQQQIFIPNDMVGAIIGKGGMKINEIRSMSGSHMYVQFSFPELMTRKINEPADNSTERLITVTGTPECNRMALYMLYQRLER